MAAKVVVGIWAGAGAADLAEVHGLPILRLTLKRCAHTGYQLAVLIPWTTDLDHVEATVKSWKAAYMIRRTSHDCPAAMRDLVAEMDADVGLVVSAQCGVIDAAELRLAAARIASTGDPYNSLRVDGFSRAAWLTVQDAGWPPHMDPRELARFYPAEPGTKLEDIDARRLWAKRPK